MQGNPARCKVRGTGGEGFDRADGGMHGLRRGARAGSGGQAHAGRLRTPQDEGRDAVCRGIRGGRGRGGVLTFQREESTKLCPMPAPPPSRMHFITRSVKLRPPCPHHECMLALHAPHALSYRSCVALQHHTHCETACLQVPPAPSPGQVRVMLTRPVHKQDAFQLPTAKTVRACCPLFPHPKEEQW